MLDTIDAYRKQAILPHLVNHCSSPQLAIDNYLRVAL